jgi:hypothetical protein
MHERAALGRRHPRSVGAPDGQAQDVADPADRVGDAGEHEQIGAARRGLREEQLRIAGLILGEAVVLPVIHAIVAVRPERQEAGDRADRRVKPSGAERRAMGRLVEGAEDEYQHVGVRDQQRQGPERGAQVPEQHTGDREHSEVGGGPSQRRPSDRSIKTCSSGRGISWAVKRTGASSCIGSCDLSTGREKGQARLPP